MYSLGKSERLCSKTLIEELLTSEESFVKYPFRFIYRRSSEPGEYPARIAVSVSKRKFKRAVKRNRIKRLARESFRLNKSILHDRLPEGMTVDILAIYLDNRLPAYAKVNRSFRSALEKISEQPFS